MSRKRGFRAHQTAQVFRVYPGQVLLLARTLASPPSPSRRRAGRGPWPGILKSYWCALTNRSGLNSENGRNRMSQTTERTYRDDLNTTLEAILSAILTSTLSDSDQKLLTLLQRELNTEKLIPPPYSIRRSTVIIKLLWSELLKELQALEHST